LRLGILALITAAHHPENGMTSIETVWSRIETHQGEEFRQVRGKVFSYSIDGTSLIPSTTNRKLPRSEFDKALRLVPLLDTKPVQHLQGPSYIYAILMDKRIRLSDW